MRTQGCKQCRMETDIYMIELIVGALLGVGLFLLGYLLGFSTGRHDTPIHPELKKRMQDIMEKKVLPSSGVGPVERPTQDMIDRYNNPNLAEEEAIMKDTFDELSRK